MERSHGGWWRTGRCVETVSKGSLGPAPRQGWHPRRFCCHKVRKPRKDESLEWPQGSLWEVVCSHMWANALLKLAGQQKVGAPSACPPALGPHNALTGWGRRESCSARAKAWPDSWNIFFCMRLMSSVWYAVTTTSTHGEWIPAAKRPAKMQEHGPSKEQVHWRINATPSPPTVFVLGRRVESV